MDIITATFNVEIPEALAWMRYNIDYSTTMSV